MLKPSQHLRLLLETPQQGRAGEARLDHLERYVSARLLLFRFVDRAHPALADDPQDQVTADSGGQAAGRRRAGIDREGRIQIDVRATDGRGSFREIGPVPSTGLRALVVGRAVWLSRKVVVQNPQLLVRPAASALSCAGTPALIAHATTLESPTLSPRQPSSVAFFLSRPQRFLRAPGSLLGAVARFLGQGGGVLVPEWMQDHIRRSRLAPALVFPAEPPILLKCLYRPAGARTLQRTADSRPCCDQLPTTLGVSGARVHRNLESWDRRAARSFSR